MAKAIIWVKISQMIAPAFTVEAETPMFDQGETDENPRPVPRVRRISDSAAAVKAPPMTAGHDMPEEWASFLTSRSGNRGSTGRGKVVCGMELAS
jgi:hypothetical protein